MISFDNFAMLHPDARRLTLHLLRTANRPHTELFFALALVWMSFNGWMSCVTKLDRDASMLSALGRNARMSAAFQRLMAEDAEFTEVVLEFSSMWPIFNSTSVRSQLGADFAYQYNTREEFVAAIYANAQIRRRPDQWVAGQVPKWKDLIAAVYQVRCNMFHGVKSPENAIDQRLVALSLAALNGFIRKSSCYEWNDGDG